MALVLRRVAPLRAAAQPMLRSSCSPTVTLRAAGLGRPHNLRTQRLLSTKPVAEPVVRPSVAPEVAAEATTGGGLSYAAFAKTYPITNNLIIATMKTGAADLVAQCVIEQKPFSEVDWQRNLVFCMFGCAYLGGFQYWYQVNIFKRFFPGIERFTTQPWLSKLTDVPGLISLGAQTVIDIGVLTFVYLPTFYVFKAGVFSSSWNPQEWAETGVSSFITNFNKDVYDLIRVWAPADIICFSVPLYMRLPVRHIVSFVWTAYLSFVRGSK